MTEKNPGKVSHVSSVATDRDTKRIYIKCIVLPSLYNVLVPVVQIHAVAPVPIERKTELIVAEICYARHSTSRLPHSKLCLSTGSVDCRKRRLRENLTWLEEQQAVMNQQVKLGGKLVKGGGSSSMKRARVGRGY